MDKEGFGGKEGFEGWIRKGLEERRDMGVDMEGFGGKEGFGD